MPDLNGVLGAIFDTSNNQLNIEVAAGAAGTGKTGIGPNGALNRAYDPATRQLRVVFV